MIKKVKKSLDEDESYSPVDETDQETAQETDPVDETTPDEKPVDDSAIKEEIASSDLDQQPEQPTNKEELNSEANDLQSKMNVPAPVASPNVPAMPTPSAPTNPMASKYQQTLDMLNQLRQQQSNQPKLSDIQGQYQKDMAMNAMLGGANKFAEASGTRYGAKIGDNADGIKQLDQLAAIPLQNYEQQQKTTAEQIKNITGQLGAQNTAEASDPNSPISQFARQQALNIMQRMNPKTDLSAMKNTMNGMSAADLEKLGFKNLGAGGGQTAIVRGYTAKYTDEQGVTHSGPVVKLGSGVLADGLTLQPLPSNATFYNQALTTGAGGQKGMTNLNTGTIEPLKNAPMAGPVSKAKVESAADNDSDDDNTEMKPKNTASISELSDLKEQDPMAYTRELNKRIMSDTPENRKSVVQIKKDYEKDIAPLRTLEDSYNILSSKLAGNQIDSGFLGAIQKQMGALANGTLGAKGKVTAQEMEKQAGAGGMSARISRAYNDSINGKLSQPDLAFFRMAGDKLMEANRQNLDDRTQLRSQQLATLPLSGMNLTADDAKLVLNTGSVLPAMGRAGLVQQAANSVPVPEGMIRVYKTGQPPHDIPKATLEQAKGRGWSEVNK